MERGNVRKRGELGSALSMSSSLKDLRKHIDTNRIPHAVSDRLIALRSRREERLKIDSTCSRPGQETAWRRLRERAASAALFSIVEAKRRSRDFEKAECRHRSRIRSSGFSSEWPNALAKVVETHEVLQIALAPSVAHLPTWTTFLVDSALRIREKCRRFMQQQMDIHRRLYCTSGEPLLMAEVVCSPHHSSDLPLRATLTCPKSFEFEFRGSMRRS
jgi:hypothetical protein